MLCPVAQNLSISYKSIRSQLLQISRAVWSDNCKSEVKKNKVGPCWHITAAIRSSSGPVLDPCRASSASFRCFCGLLSGEVLVAGWSSASPSSLTLLKCVPKLFSSTEPTKFVDLSHTDPHGCVVEAMGKFGGWNLGSLLAPGVPIVGVVWCVWGQDPVLLCLLQP